MLFNDYMAVGLGAKAPRLKIESGRPERGP